MARRFALLDRDGTIIVEKHYLSSPDQVELIAGAAEGLRILRAAGIGIIIITNQAAIGRGYFDVATLDGVHARLRDLLRQEGVEIDAIYYCPHHPDDRCDCRKPKPLLAERAAREHGFSLADAFVVGDKDIDIGVAHATGSRSVLVRTGYGKEHETSMRLAPDFVADDLLGAARIIRSEAAKTST